MGCVRVVGCFRNFLCEVKEPADSVVQKGWDT